MPNHDARPLATRSAIRWRAAVTWLLAILILVPSMLGFGAKFAEFVNTFRQESGGVFAITPMVNYVLASLGFLCLLVWAAMNGMFHDIERPKHAMLEQQQALDLGRLPATVSEGPRRIHPEHKHGRV